MDNQTSKEKLTCIIDMHGNKEYFFPDGTRSHIVYTNGRTVYWSGTSSIHRVDGPAWIGNDASDGYSMWYINGEKHREDGPAIEVLNSGSSTSQHKWFLHNKSYSLEDYCKELYKDGWEMYFTKYMLIYG